ncbi:SPAC4A8.02c [Scenedesmus sp. PABB004]|nr:SPAC4A8.02c [Scenedesmus sp. PABB004]
MLLALASRPAAPGAALRLLRAVSTGSSGVTQAPAGAPTYTYTPPGSSVQDPSYGGAAGALGEHGGLGEHKTVRPSKRAQWLKVTTRKHASPLEPQGSGAGLLPPGCSMSDPHYSVADPSQKPRSLRPKVQKVALDSRAPRQRPPSSRPSAAAAAAEMQRSLGRPCARPVAAPRPGCPGRPGLLRVSCTASADAQAAQAAQATQWLQRTISLPQHRRGCHVITRKLLSELPELAEFEVGLANITILHTSASLTVNENASPDVPLDLNDALDRLAPEGPGYRHDDEGSDDMPAHVKSSLMGPSLTLPVSRGRLALGTWQGIYLNEHRNQGGPRDIVVTVQGLKRADGRRYGEYR